MGRHHSREADGGQWHAATLTRDGARSSTHSRDDEDDEDTTQIPEQARKPTD